MKYILKLAHLQVHWLARHPEHEQAWLNVLAEEERYCGMRMIFNIESYLEKLLAIVKVVDTLLRCVRKTCWQPGGVQGSPGRARYVRHRWVCQCECQCVPHTWHCLVRVVLYGHAAGSPVINFLFCQMPVYCAPGHLGKAHSSTTCHWALQQVSNFCYPLLQSV